MRRDLYIAIGVQRCFFSSEGTLFPGQQALQALSLIETFLAGKEENTIFSRLIRNPEDSYYLNEPTYCIVGSSDIEFAGRFSKVSKTRIVAQRPSLVKIPSFMSIVKKIDVDTVHIVGAETHSSVLFTVADLRDLGYRVVIYPSMLVSRDQYLHDSAITIMASTLGAEVADG